jgi:hypothetical protein
MNRYLQPIFVALTLAVVSPVIIADDDNPNNSQPPQGYRWGPGMMQGPGYGYGPGMMRGPGYGPGYHMGPGMMYGPGYGYGSGMGPGMMYGPGHGPGYPMGPGMMYGPGYGPCYGQQDDSDSSNTPYPCHRGMMHDRRYGGWR